MMYIIMRLISPYRKALLYALGAVIIGFQSYATDDIFTPAEIMQSFLAGLGLFLVYVLPEAPGAKYVKAGVGLIVAAAQIVVAALEAGEPLDSSLWVNVAVAIVAALGLVPMENEPEPAVPPTAGLPATPTPPPDFH
jgi:peptidoglycan/LPS O-acetylase OafA/YrhL